MLLAFHALRRRLRDLWRDARCGACQRMIDIANARGDSGGARLWQRRLQRAAGWED